MKNNLWMLKVSIGTSLIVGAVQSQVLRAEDNMTVRGFGDISLTYDKADPGRVSTQLGEFDLFLARPIDKKVNMLAEVVFQPSYHGVGVDLERLYAQYVVSPWLKIALGRYHTALGYWNETFHHGRYLATSATRPVFEEFEDAGGLLPAHTTGIEIRGNGLVGSGNFGYIFDIGNGRGPVKDPPAFYFNYNKSQSYSGMLYYEFENGIRVGTNFYHSRLPGGAQKDDDGSPITGVVGPAGNEWIVGAHFVYNSPSIEWLNEYEFVKHSYDLDNPLNATSFSTFGGTSLSLQTANIHLFYSQFGYHIGLFTPYIRWEHNGTNTADAYLNVSTGADSPGLLVSTNRYTPGLRYEISSSSALKWEYTYIAPVSGDTDWNTLINWSFGW